MPDLADRISRGAVAALDLAPFDDRFARLSRQVLAGGASRFSRVVADDEPVQYVVPVGLPHERIDYGALVIQTTRAGVVWRDAGGVDHHRVADLGGQDAHFSGLTLGGEQWVRFDIGDDFTVLVPPVSSPELRRTVARLLDARPGTARTGTVPEPEREPAPVVVATPEPQEPVEPQEPAVEPEPESVWQPDEAPVDADATQAMPVAEPDGDGVPPEQAGSDADQTVALDPDAPDPDQTVALDTGAPDRDVPAPDVPDPDATVALQAAPVGAGATAAMPAPAPEAPRPEDDEVELYRAEDRQPGVSPLPAATRAPLGDDHAQAVAAPPAHDRLTPTRPVAAPASASPGRSLTLRGFFIGLAAALVGGGLALAIRLLAG